MSYIVLFYENLYGEFKSLNVARTYAQSLLIAEPNAKITLAEVLPVTEEEETK